MKGQHVKEKLLKNGYKLKDVAQSMGIIPQNLQTLLSADDIKTGVLESIANSINKTIYFFYENEGNTAISDNKGISVAGNSNHVNEGIEKLVDVIHNQSNQLSKSQEQIDRLLTIIENLNK